MTASRWEYRYRFWIQCGLFLLAFALRRGPRAADGISGLFDWPPSVGARVVYVAAAVLVATAAWLRTWASAYLGSEVVNDGAVRTGDVLADGPYRHVRNPLYLANVLFAVGAGACATLTGWCVVVIGEVVLVLRLIGREERALVDEQREAYLAYCRAVPHRLWPSFAPKVARRATVPRWGEAAIAELFMWGCMVACLAGAVTLRGSIAAWIALGSLAAWLVLLRVIDVRAAAADDEGDGEEKA
jgi:protein-S-isoprenylcysteine O-methyltransferase Ste14